jgi:hypothetical protein
MMTEAELELRALELAVLEVCALLDPSVLARAEASIAEALEAGSLGDADETAIRRSAVALICAARTRRKMFTPARDMPRA